MILVDAGPLVALIHVDDRHHAACRSVLAALREPMITVWPAFTEAMYLLGFSWKGQQALWEMASTEALRFASLGENDLGAMRNLMAKYRDLPMDLADAALVHVAAREAIHTVFTVDRRDFLVYRLPRNRRLAIVP